ncbi:MAG: hypothetical protein ACOY3Y_15805 [Acidobacteriota bacterium]
MKALSVALAGLVLCAGSVLAEYRAADLVVVPVTAALAGVNNSQWRTDVEIVNVDSVAIDVLIIFLPTGGGSNRVWFSNIDNALGGRTEDSFGHIDAALKDIQPGEQILVPDIIKTVWGDNNRGALLVFAYEAGSFQQTDPPGGRPRRIVVTSRTYTLGKDADNNDVTYGQQIPGLPWYTYLDPHQKTKGYDHAILTGIREDAAYRTNFGMVNVSDPLTTLEVELTLTLENGTEVKDLGTTVSPLSHQQYDRVVTGFFAQPADPVTTNARITAAVRAWSSQAENPTPGLMIYASRIDNRTNDPVYIEQAWTVEMPWDCVFNGNCASLSAQSTERGTPRRRPLSPPTP